MSQRRRVLLVGLLLGLLAAACGSGSDSLVVYSGRSESLIGPLIEQFEAESGIEVEVRYAGSDELALLIAEEGERSPADVFISQSPGATGFLAERDLLREIDDSVLSATPDRFHSSSGLWVGLSGRIRVLVYNRDLVEESALPASVFDLVEPEYAGLVGVAPANGSFQDFVTAMRQTQGEERTEAWLIGMAGNESPTYSGNSAIVDAVGRGEVAYGLVNHYYNFRAQAENPDVASVNHYFPTDDIGSLVIVTAAGITSASEAVDAATELLAFLVDTDAQTFFTEETFEYPLASGVEAWSGLPAMGDVDGLTYDFDTLGAELEATRDLIESSGLIAP